MTKMGNLFTFSIIILYFLQEFYCFETLPVLVIDTGGVSIMGANVGNPFNKITSEIFTEMVKVIVAKAAVTLIFVECELNIESITKRDSQGSPFKAFLQDMGSEKKLLYLPSVIDPYHTLTSVLPETPENSFDLATAKKIAKKFKPSSHVYIKFEPDELTVEKLRIHDLAMRAIVRAAQTNTNGTLVAFYTGANNPLVIERAIYPKIKKNDEKSVLIASRRALFRLSVDFERKGLRELRSVEQIGVKHEHEERSLDADGDDKLSTTLSFPGFDLQFNFTLRTKDWILDDIGLLEFGVEVGHTKIGTGAPLRSSYHCAETLRIVNTLDQSTVVLRRYQWQPARESCELTKKGCEDKSIERHKLPIGTIKDLKKPKDLFKPKFDIDGDRLDENETSGPKKSPKPKHFDYEALYEAESDHKAHEESEKGPKKQHANKHKKKPVNKYVDTDIDESYHTAIEEAVIEHFGNKHKDGEHGSNSGGAEDKFDHKKQSSDDSINAPQNSHGESKVNLETKKNSFVQNKQAGFNNKDAAIDKYVTHKANAGAGKDPFGQKKHLNDAGNVPFDQNKDLKDAGKDSFGQNEHPDDAAKDPFGQIKQSYDTGKDPFGQNKHPKDAGHDPFGQNKHHYGDDNKHKTNKQEGKGHSDNNKNANNKGGLQNLNDSHLVENQNKKAGQNQAWIKDTQHLFDQNRDDDNDNSKPVDTSDSNTPPADTSGGNNPPLISNIDITSPVSINDLAFGSSVNCGPFFNHEILSCLMVTFIIIAMFFYGLETMMNLQANDRFDDFSGGKTLHIAEEK